MLVYEQLHSSYFIKMGQWLLLFYYFKRGQFSYIFRFDISFLGPRFWASSQIIMFVCAWWIAWDGSSSRLAYPRMILCPVKSFPWQIKSWTSTEHRFHQPDEPRNFFPQPEPVKTKHGYCQLFSYFHSVNHFHQNDYHYIRFSTTEVTSDPQLIDKKKKKRPP